MRVVAFINSFIVFLISGLALRTDELKDIFAHRGALGGLFGLVSIIGITPLMAWAVRGLPFEPKEFATGIAIFAIMPTTVRQQRLVKAWSNVVKQRIQTRPNGVVDVVTLTVQLRVALRQ